MGIISFIIDVIIGIFAFIFSIIESLISNGDKEKKIAQKNISTKGYRKQYVQTPKKTNQHIDYESFKKGEEFENFVRQRLFTKDKYTIIERTHSFQTNKDDYVESTLKPDFKFRDNRTGKEFYIEAKWRQSLYNNQIQWSKPYQIDRYKKYALECNLYVVIGIGGSANNPDYLFLEDINKLDSITLKEKQLEKIVYEDQVVKYRLN